MSEDNIRQSKWDDMFQNMEDMLTSAISKAGKAAKEEDKFTDAIDRNTKATERNNKAKRESAKITPKRSQMNDYWSNSKEEGRGWVQEALKNYKNSENGSMAQKENARELVKIMNAFRAQWQSVEGFTKEMLQTYQDLQNSVDAQGRRVYSNKSGFGFDVRTFADAFREAGLYKANGLSIMNEADVNKRIGDIELEINNMLKNNTLQRKYNTSTNEAKQLLSYLKENWDKTQNEAKQKNVDFNRRNFPELFEKRDLLNQKYSTFSGKDKDLHNVNTLLSEYRELTNYVAKSASDIPKYIQELNNYFNPNDYKRQVNAGKRNAESIMYPGDRDDRLSSTDLARGTSSSSDGMNHFKEETQEAESMVDNLGRKIDKTFGKRLSGTKLVNDLGQVIALVHSSNEEFEEFDLNKSRFGKMGYGAYMALDDSYASKHPNKTTSEWYANIAGRIIDSDKDRLTDDDANAIMERFMPNVGEDTKKRFVKRLTEPFNQAKDAIKEIAEKAGVEYKDVLAHIDIDAIYKNLSGNKEILILDPSKLVKANQAIIEQGDALQRIAELRNSGNLHNWFGEDSSTVQNATDLLFEWEKNKSEKERAAYINSETGQSSISVTGTNGKLLKDSDLQRAYDYMDQMGIVVDTIIHTHPMSNVADLQKSDIELAFDKMQNGMDQLRYMVSVAGDEVGVLDARKLLEEGVDLNELEDKRKSLVNEYAFAAASDIGYEDIMRMDPEVLSNYILDSIKDSFDDVEFKPSNDDIDALYNEIYNSIVQGYKDNSNIANDSGNRVLSDEMRDKLKEAIDRLFPDVSFEQDIFGKRFSVGSDWLAGNISDKLDDNILDQFFNRSQVQDDIFQNIDQMKSYSQRALQQAIEELTEHAGDYVFQILSRNEYLSRLGLEGDGGVLNNIGYTPNEFNYLSNYDSKDLGLSFHNIDANLELAAQAEERRANAAERRAKAEKEAESSSAQENNIEKEAAATEETAQTEERRGEAVKKTSEVTNDLVAVMQNLNTLLSSAFNEDNLDAFKRGLDDILNDLDQISKSLGVINEEDKDQSSVRDRLRTINNKVGKSQFNVHLSEDHSVDAQQMAKQEEIEWERQYNRYLTSYNKIFEIADKYYVDMETLLTSLRNSPTFRQENPGVDPSEKFSKSMIDTGTMRDRVRNLMEFFRYIKVAEDEAIESRKAMEQMAKSGIQRGDINPNYRTENDPFFAMWNDIKAYTSRPSFPSTNFSYLNQKMAGIYQLKDDKKNASLKEQAFDALTNFAGGDSSVLQTTRDISALIEQIQALQAVLNKGLGVSDKKGNIPYLQQIKRLFDQINESVKQLITSIQNLANQQGIKTVSDAMQAVEPQKPNGETDSLVHEASEETVASTAAAATEITEEGKAAEEAAKNKLAFVEANQQVAKSGKETEEQIKNATDAINDEGAASNSAYDDIVKEERGLDGLGKTAKLSAEEIEQMRNEAELLNRIDYGPGNYSETYKTERGDIYTLRTRPVINKKTKAYKTDDDGNLITVTHLENIKDAYQQLAKEAGKTYVKIIKDERELLELLKANAQQEDSNTKALRERIAYHRRKYETQSANLFDMGEFANSINPKSNYQYADFQDYIKEIEEQTTLDLNVKYSRSRGSTTNQIQKELEVTQKCVTQAREKIKDLQASFGELSQKPIKLTQHRQEIEKLLADIEKLLKSMEGAPSTLDQRLDITQKLHDAKLLISEYQQQENLANRQLTPDDTATTLIRTRAQVKQLISQSSEYKEATEEITKELEKQLYILQNITRVKWNEQTGAYTRGRNVSAEEQAKTLNHVMAKVKQLRAEYGAESKAARLAEKDIITLLRQRARALQDISKYDVNTAEYTNAVNSFVEANKALSGVDLTKMSRSVKTAFDTTQRQTEKQISTIRSQLIAARDLYQEYFGSDLFGETAQENLDVLSELFGGDIENIDLGKMFATDPDGVTQKLRTVLAAFDEFVSKVRNTKDIKSLSLDIKLLSDAFYEMDDAGSRFPGLARRIGDLEDEIKELAASSQPSEEQIRKLKEEVAALRKELEKYKKANAASSFEELGQSISKLFKSTLGRFVQIERVVSYMRRMYSSIKEVDSALTELRKVSDVSNDRLQASFEKSSETAKTLGAVITDVIKQTSDWARLGYSIDEAEDLAYYSTLFQHVGDNMNAEQASEYLISTIHGFGLESKDTIDIINKYNEVANNFAIDTAGIGRSLTKSAASFSAANTDLSQSIALITAANTVIQNPDTVGTMWKTLQARIRSATTELTELGEEQDRFTKSTSKLQKMVKGLTGFDILEADGKTFKSIYDIILGIGEAWDKLDDIDQAALGEALAGKRNLNALNAVMQNLDVVREAYKAAEESAGSAEREQRNYAKSIQYSADVFKTTLQDLELQFINAKQTKAFVDLATKLLEIINKIVDTIGPVATAGGLFTITLGAKHFDKTVQMFKDIGTIIKTLKTGEEGFLGAKGSLAVTKAGLVTFGKYALIIGAVVGAFTLLNKAEEKYGHTAWALGKQIDASNDKLDELSNQAEDTARNIKNLNDKIDELRKKGSLSITDRQDLKNLIAEREELEKIQKENQKDTDEEVNNRAKKQQELFNRKGYADDYTIFNLSSADVGMSESDYEAYRGAYLSKWNNDYQELVKMQSDMLAGGLELTDEYKILSSIIDEVEKKYHPVERNMKKYNEYLAKFVSTANSLENKQSIINLLDVNGEEAQSLLALDIHDLILEAAKKGKLTMQDLQGIGFYDAFDFGELLGVSDPKNYLLDQVYSEAANQSEEAEIRNTLRALYKNRDFLTTTSSGVNGSPLSEELAKVNNDIAINEKKLEQYEGVLTRLEKDPSNLNILSNLSTNVKPVTDIMNALNEGVLTEDGMVSLDKRTEALAQFRESIADLDDKIDLGDFDVSGETSKLIDGVMSSVTDEDYKKATQEFWTNLLYNSNALKGVTQDNKQLVKEAFESMGISNADIIVETHLKDPTLQIPVEFVPDKSIAFRNDGTVGGALFNVNKKSAPLTAIQSMYGEAISGDIFDPSKIDLTGLESTLKSAADEAGISWDKFKDNYENFVSTVDSSTSSGEFMGAVNELANAWTEASDILYGVNEDNKEQVISTLTQKGAKNAREYVESQLSDDPIKIPLEMEFDSKALKQDGTIATAVKDFTNKLKPAFDTLGNLYQSIFYKDGNSAFNMKDFGGDQLNEVYDTFVKGATEIGMSFEEATQHYNDFVGVMTKEGVTVDEAHNAINDLISSYVYSSDVLDNLNDETAGVMRTMLKEVGVTNYDEITTKALALAKEHLAGKNLALKASESGLIKSGEDLVNTNWDNVNSLLAEENASDAARAAFVDLVMQQNILANSKLDLEQKIVALSELAAVTLGVGASYKYAAYQQKAFEMKKNPNAQPIKGKNGSAYAYIPGDESESVTGPEVDPGFQFDSEKQILDELVNLVKTTVSELYKGATGNTRFNLNPQDQEKEKTGDKENHNRFENIIDWVEIGIKRLQRTAEDFGKTANNTYETWSERGTALRKELETTRQTAIAISRSKQTYDKKAAQIQNDFTFEKVKKDLMLDASEDSPISKLTEKTFNSVAKDWNSYIDLIQTGRWSGKLADLEEFKGDSNTAKGAVLQRMYEKLIEYQEYWEKSLDAEDQLNDNIISQGDLYVQALEMWATAYEQKLTKIETYSSYVDEQLSQSEARGYVASEAFYRRQLKYNAAERKTLQSEYAQIAATLEHAVIGDETSKGKKGIKTNGGIEMSSEEYEKQQQKLREIRKQLEENETAELELNNSIRDVKWQVFDMIIDRMEKLTSETEFLAQIFDENQLYVKKYDEGAGQFTDEGMAVAGTHAINYNVKMRESQYLATEAAKIKKELEDDQWNQDLQNRYDDLIAKQREAILAAEAEKDAIRDMVSNGIDIEMEHIQWLVDEYEKALDAQKNLYDYSKNLRKQTKAVSDLQKQLSAYKGDTSEENRQRLQQLNNNLKDQQEALQEMQYDRFMSDQKDLLSDLVADYEVVLKRRLEDTDRLMKEIIVDVNDNAQLIATTLESKAESLGASISPELNNIFTSAIETNKHLTDYFDPTGGSFTQKLNSVNEELTNIYRYLHDEMVAALQKDAKEQMSAFGDILKGVAGGELSDPGDNGIVLQGIVSRFNDAVQLAKDKSIEENQYIEGKKWKEANMSRHYAYTSYKDAEGIIDEAKKNGGSETLVDWMNDQLQGIKEYYVSLEALKAIKSGKKLPSSGGTGGTGGSGGSGGGSGSDGTGGGGDQNQGNKKTLHKITKAAKDQEVWVAKDTHILSKSGEDNGTQYFKNSSAYTKDGYVRYTVLGVNGNLVHVGIGDGSSGYTGTFELGKLWAYAKGTSHVSSDRMAWTQEKGLEAIIRPTDGAVLTPLKRNDAVLNAAATANMFDFANNPLQFMRGLMGANVGKTIVNSGTTNNDINMSITLPNVTNYEQFKYALQHDKQFENMVQTMTLGRMMGKSSIAKYSA